MPAEQLRIEAHLAAHTAHLILKEHAEGLHNGKLHVVGEPADVVVALDGGARPAGGGDAFDDVRVNGTLPEPLDALEESALVVEDIDEGGADGLALAFWIGDPGQGGVEPVRGADALHVEPHAFIALEHLVEFILAEEAVVDENAVEPVADGPVQQHRRHARVDPATQAEDDPVIAQFFLELGHGRVDEVGRRPVGGASADVVDKVAEQSQPLLAVVHLRVELDAPGGLVLEGEAGKLHVLRAAGDAGAVACALDGVAVAHPHRLAGGHAGEEPVGVVDLVQMGAAVFAAVAGFDAAAASLGQPLRAEAHAEQRPFGADPVQVGGRRIGLSNAVGAAGENDALPIPALRIVLRSGLEQGTPIAVPRLDFSERVQLPDPARDELRVLGTEIENEDAVHVCSVSGQNYAASSAPQGERMRREGVVLHHRCTTPCTLSPTPPPPCPCFPRSTDADSS